jgi:hypothetical protein
VTPAESAQAFAAALLGDHGEMCKGLQLTLATFTSGASGPSTRWLPATADSLASAITQAAGGSTTLGVYVGVGLTRGPRAIDPATQRPYKRLAKADVDGLVWLWIDIDIAGGGHAGSRMSLCPDMATALKLIASVGLAPTVLVNTGHGVQAHWRLREPFIYGAVDVDDDGAPVIDESRVEPDRKAGEELAWAWVKSFQIRGREMGGFHVDPVTDPSRLVRCPGSWNRKVEGDHREVVMLECDASRVYDVEDFQAVLMPEKLLAPLRFDRDVLTGDLVGVDLAALWVQVSSAPNHEPSWLSNIFDLNVAPELEALWNGERDAEFGGDDSSIDMALAAALLKWRLSPGDAAQAIMGRRLRVGRKIEKVDPARRVDYLARTVGKVVARIRAEEATERARLVADEKVTAMLYGPPPVVAEDEIPFPEPPDDEPSGGAAAPDEPEPTRPTLRAVPPLPPALDGGVPSDVDPPPPPPKSQEGVYIALRNQMGLPGEIRVQRVEERYMEDGPEVRVWLFRTESDAVFGGKWAPGTTVATLWHPKKSWTAATQVKEILQLDLNCFVTLPRGWATDLNGLKLLYLLAHQVEIGTPVKVASWGIAELITVATATGKFSTAVVSRDPWLNDRTELWIPWTSIQRSVANLGYPQPKPRHFIDTLERMQCTVRGNMAISEGHRVVRDVTQWVRVPRALLGEDLWVNMVERSAQRDREDQSNGKRVIGPHG